MADQPMSAEERFVSEMFDVVMDFRHSLWNETDRGCALIAAEFLSSELAALLRRRFVDDGKACDAVLEDRSHALVIGPRLTVARSIGGSKDDQGTAIAVDANGNTFITGFTLAIPPATSP